MICEMLSSEHRPSIRSSRMCRSISGLTDSGVGGGLKPNSKKSSNWGAQLVNELARDPIGPGEPGDFAVDPQTQQSLQGNLGARYSVKIRPSSEFHDGQFLLFGVGTTLQP
jgi:hypothetical protein